MSVARSYDQKTEKVNDYQINDYFNVSVQVCFFMQSTVEGDMCQIHIYAEEKVEKSVFVSCC